MCIIDFINQLCIRYRTKFQYQTCSALWMYKYIDNIYYSVILLQRKRGSTYAYHFLRKPVSCYMQQRRHNVWYVEMAPYLHSYKYISVIWYTFFTRDWTNRCIRTLHQHKYYELLNLYIRRIFFLQMHWTLSHATSL